jgi:hypothetical protein
MERRESVQRQVFSQRIVARAALQGCVEGFFGDAERSETIAYMRVSRECIQRRRGIGRISGPCGEENCRPSGTYNRHNSPGRPWAGCSPTHSSGCPRFEEKKGIATLFRCRNSAKHPSLGPRPSMHAFPHLLARAQHSATHHRGHVAPWWGTLPRWRPILRRQSPNTLQSFLGSGASVPRLKRVYLGDRSPSARPDLARDTGLCAALREIPFGLVYRPAARLKCKITFELILE